MDYGKAPEDPKPALEWIKKNGEKFGVYINGESNIPEGRESFETRNPATGEILATICQAKVDDVDRAMQSLGRHRQTGRNWWFCQGKISLAIARLVQNIRASSRSSKHWTMENRFGKAGILIFHWLPGISIFMPVPLS